MKKLFFFLLLLVGVLVTIGGVFAYVPVTDTNRGLIEERIYSYNNTYVINYSHDGQEYRVTNLSQIIGAGRIFNKSFKLLEMDGSIGQKIEIGNNGTTISFTTFENPEHPYSSSRVPLRVCVNNVDFLNANRFETDVNYCNHDKEYYFGNVKIGETYTVRIREGTVLNMSGLLWWLGEDDYDGTFGQGGIGYCDYVFADIYRNQTQTWVNSTFIMGMKWEGTDADCTASRLEEQNYLDTSAWKLISTGSLYTNLVCPANNCYKVSPARNTWYYRTVKCDEAGNRSLRVYILSGFTAYNSPTRNMECLNVPTPISDGVAALWVFGIPFLMMMIVTVFVSKKKKRGDKDD